MAHVRSKSFAQEMIQAHAVLDRSLEQLERVTHSAQGRHLYEVLHLLQGVAEELQAHFNLEERDGYMASVLKHAPQFTHRAQELLGEHGHLKTSLVALIQEASSKLPDDFWARVSEWLAQVRQHESRENQVVQEAFNRDTAGED
jgi:hypothetical protein